MKYDNLLLVTGSGRNSGKTTFVCRVIEQFKNIGIISIKISPHFHVRSPGLVHISGQSGFDIYEETSVISTKDSSRMLKSGAAKVFYVQSEEERIMKAFSDIYTTIPSEQPVICESPALINYLDPGSLIMMVLPEIRNPKTIYYANRLPDLELRINELTARALPIEFLNGQWICLK
jgi:hypothetical protein